MFVPRVIVPFAFLPLLAAAPLPVEPVTPSALVSEVVIPHATFRLPNGLTVIVHEDHKAPVVAVNVWYNVGSKDEPKGKTGFAHLFEHLMFNGSQNAPGDYFKYLQDIGATDYNGTTSNDRTNYYETVPKGALERALFLESDRMGWLSGALSQAVLDNQRAVVQNEKRQGDSKPGGLIRYSLFGGLFPPGHPYHHTPIGSMADLDKATLADVKAWFHDKYGPNNATLVIAGDVTEAQVRPLVEKYFGAIPAGPVNHPAKATIPTLAAPKAIALKDAVAMTIVQRYWPVPGLLDKDLAALDVGGAVLGGLSSSRLDNILVRNEQSAVAVSAGLTPLQRAGIFSVTAYVKPGEDPAKVAKRLDQIVADYVAKGPTDDEVQRAVMGVVASQVRGLEQVGGDDGKAASLAEGQVFAGNSDFYKDALATYAALTPEAVKTAMQKWLRRPSMTIVVSPGERGSYDEAKAVDASKPASTPVAAPVRTAPPITTDSVKLDFPTITHLRLANGIPVSFVQRSSVPITQVAVTFDAGGAADEPAKRGLSSMTMALLDEGTTSLSAQALAEAKERLGAELSTGATQDRSTVYLSALTPNLAPSLALMSDIIRDPAFRTEDIERLRNQRLTSIAQSVKDPTKAGMRLVSKILYGSNHPYGGPPQGDPAAIKSFTIADFRALQQRWLRPDNARIFVVSDKSWSEVGPQIDARFGTWAAPPVPKGVKNFGALPARPTAPKILLIDRPGAPQSTITGVELIPLDPAGDVVTFGASSQILGGDFLSRMNMDLREEKGWSYGVQGGETLLKHAVPYAVSAPVQADRTGDAIAEIVRQMDDFLTSKGVTKDELDRTIAANIKQLPGQFETAGSVLGAMMDIDLYGRPDDYYATLDGQFRGLTQAKLDAAARAMIDPKGMVWIVTGDAAKVRPQLDKLGMPIEVVTDLP